MRIPPAGGTSNSWDSIRSPATVVDALSRVPGVSPSNCARPASSVVDVFATPGPFSSTACFGIGFVSCPRMTRTVTVPAGISPTGSGMPDICLGSGIACARTSAGASTTAASDRTSAPLRMLEPRAASLAERGVGVVVRAATGARTRRTDRAWRFRRAWLRRRAAEPRLQLLLDAVAVRDALIELPHDGQGAAAQTTRHLVEILRRHFAHRAIELQFLDRPEDEHLL